MLKRWMSLLADRTELFGMWQYIPEHWFDQYGDVSDDLAFHLR